MATTEVINAVQQLLEEEGVLQQIRCPTRVPASSTASASTSSPCSPSCSRTRTRSCGKNFVRARSAPPLGRPLPRRPGRTARHGAPRRGRINGGRRTRRGTALNIACAGKHNHALVPLRTAPQPLLTHSSPPLRSPGQSRYAVPGERRFMPLCACSGTRAALLHRPGRRAPAHPAGAVRALACAGGGGGWVIGDHPAGASFLRPT